VFRDRPTSVPFSLEEASSSFEPDVFSMSVIQLQHRSCSVYMSVFRQAGPPQRVDCLASK